MSTENSDIESETSEIPAEEDPQQTIPDKQPEPTGSIETNPPSSRGGSVLAFFAFLFALAALLGTAWMWWQDQASAGQEEQRILAEVSRLESSDSKLSLDLGQIRDQLKALSADDSGAEMMAVQQQMQADRSKVAQVEQTLNEQMSMARSLQAASESLHGRLMAAEAALSGMSTRELDAGNEMDLAEVDYLLRLANERLKLFSDPVAADQALDVADAHLASLDNPMYLGLRQEIATARRELASVQMPDYLDISGRLVAIQQQVTSLPFLDGEPLKRNASQEAGDGWWEKLKGVFSNLVTVRRSTEEEGQKITLQDKDYIRQSAWLQLEVAQLALMRRDQQEFRTSLERVKESLSKWFDTGDSKYLAVIKGIDELAATEIQVAMPDITAPWSTLNMLRSSRPSTPPPAVPQTEEQTPAVTVDEEDEQG